MSEKTEAMTPERIAEIKAREGKATPGPWGLEYVELRVLVEGESLCLVCGQDRRQNEENALFIYHAREDVPALLAEVERWQRVARYLAKKLTHDDGSENSGFPSGKWQGATHGDYGSLYRTREEAVQSWIDEAEREVGNERN